MKSSSSIKLETPARAYALLLQSLCTDLSLSSELSNRINGLARSRSYKSLVDLADELSSQQYESVSEHFRYNQLALFIRKVPFIDKALRPEDVALAKFKASEHRMARVNRKMRLVRARLDGRTTLSVPQQALFLERVRKFIADALGPLNMEEVVRECYFGDGSAVGCRGDATHVVNKMRGLTLTPGALPYFEMAIQKNATLSRLTVGEFSPFVNKQLSRYKHWVAANVELVDHNLVTFVPKTAKTHRTIAIEPSANGFLQLGIGRVIASRLKRFGCDIQDQSKNQAYARFGSEQWVEPFSIATIDLSAASDSISKELVRLLLPPDWWGCLNALRSPSYRLDGDTQSSAYEKFATMGNGFCFPLQTLIYLGIVRSCLAETGDTLHAVYGDDIAVPKGAALLVIERLRYCGFRVNVDKTFVAGPFRESCGADFFSGKDVRPFVLDYLPENTQDYVKIANGIGEKLGLNSLTAATALRLLPEHKRFVKPHRTGAVDDAILVELDQFMCSRFARWDPDRMTWNFKVFASESLPDDILLTEYEQLLALNHGSIPGKERTVAKVSLGTPTLPRRFTARYKGKWYLPVLKPHPLNGEDVPGTPAA